MTTFTKYFMDNSPTISRPVFMWKGRLHSDIRKRKGDTCASPTDKGKGASMVQMLGTSRPVAWPDISRLNSDQLGKDDMYRRAVRNLIQ